MLTHKLAWRSFLRHKRRSIITVLAVAISLAVMILMVAVMNDSHEQIAELAIKMGVGHITVQAPGYKEERTLDHVVNDPEPVLAAARRVPGAIDAVQRVIVSGLCSTGEDSAAVLIAGVDPKREPRVSDIAAKKRRLSGSWIRSRAEMRFKNQPADVYVGRALAKRLALAVGDRLVLTATPRGGGRAVSSAFLVRGTFTTAVAELDSTLVQIPIDAAKRMLKMRGAATEVSVLLDKMERTAPATAALKKALAGVKGIRVMPWQQARKDLADALDIDTASGYITVGILFLIVAIGIFNTMLMSVLERTREFGVMMAIGTRPSRMFSIVLSEAFVLALVASAFGVAIGLGFTQWVASSGIDINKMVGTEAYEFAGVAFEGKIYARLYVADVLIWVGVTVALVLLSAIYPAWRATRLQPVEAMRHV
ncbi:MAG: ABC transporter permease [Myxococcales bacterium]|nr:ABC transporter permease [Myxococcales bacterium]